MPGATSRLALPYPLSSEAADGPAAFLAIANALDKAAITSQGVFASRPVSTGGSPGITGRWYYATDQAKIYYDLGTSWVDLTPPAIGADSITAFHIAPNAVGASELADNAVDAAAIAANVITAAKIAAGTITATELANALKPSGGAGAGTEALRALGTAAANALPGNHFSATPVTAAYSASRTNGQTYTITAPVAGTYIIEWGAGALVTSGSGSTAGITCDVVGGRASYDFGNTGGSVVRTVTLTGGQVATFTVAGTGFFTSLDHCWSKLIRIA